MTDREGEIDVRTLFLSRAVFVLRIFLGIVFLHYGIGKLLGGQFFYGNWTLNKNSVDGGALVFAFYGYSTVYARFLGACEALPALLLFFPRTATLGAGILFGVSLNITVMDFCYGGMLHRVKYLSLAFTLMLAFLLLSDLQRLRLAFWPDLLAKPGSKPSLFTAGAFARPPASSAGRLLLKLGIAVLLSAAFVGVLTQITPRPQELAAEWLQQQGWKDENLRFLRMRSWGSWAVNKKMTRDCGLRGKRSELEEGDSRARVAARTILSLARGKGYRRARDQVSLSLVRTA